MTTRETPWAPGTPCWDDLLTSDADDARAFYAELFGWRFEVGGPETGHYAMARLDDRPVAGVMPGDQAPPVWTTYLASGDLDRDLDAAVRAGATVLAPAMDVMDAGRMAVVADPTGAVFGMWQAGTHAGTGLANVPGTPMWNELLTRDLAAAKEFYAAVFGCTYQVIPDVPDYVMVEVDGDVVGGMGAMPADVPADVPSHWKLYLATDATDDVVDHAVKLGASVTTPPADMPYGRVAELADRQGAAFSVITPPHLARG